MSRGVINPQNGHILCDLKPRACGLSSSSSLINESAMKASFLHKRLRNRRRLGAIFLLSNGLSCPKCSEKGSLITIGRSAASLG
jgi:hypothetical protein